MSEPCRVCAANTIPWLDLGVVPLANALTAADAPSPPAYPLAVARCPACGLSQLREPVDPKTLFTAAYPYASGVAAVWTKHCQALAKDLATAHPGGLVLDIGSNDGTMLAAGRDALLRMRGVDPVGPADYRGLFPQATQHLPSWGFDAVIAQNVLAHTPDPHGFLAEIERLLKPDGTLVIEVPYVRDLLARGAFDTIYHEHVSYFSLTALRLLLEPHHFAIVDVLKLPDLHGGSVRITAAPYKGVGYDPGPDEGALRASYLYDRFHVVMEKRLERLWSAFAGTKGRIAAFGASAKGAVFAKACGLGPAQIAYVADETPAKQGLKTPYGVPIGPLDWLRQEPPDLVWITPWNFDREIRAKLKPYGVKKLVTV